jgi:hypothetical protein
MQELALALLMLRVFLAHNNNTALSADRLTITTHGFYGRAYFHSIWENEKPSISEARAYTDGAV